MDPMTLVLVGAGAQAAVQLVTVLGQWLTLRARAQLARAVASVPAGANVSARDDVGAWVVRRDRMRGQR